MGFCAGAALRARCPTHVLEKCRASKRRRAGTPAPNLDGRSVVIRVDIETIVMAAGPVPSAIILRERPQAAAGDAPLRSLSIQTGSFEAAAISKGIDGAAPKRPVTHDLFLSALETLGARVERVEITRFEQPVFYANIALLGSDGQEHLVDARPSDALALAVRSNAPIYVEDDVMNRNGTVSYRDNQKSEEEFERFNEFVHTVSPDDF